MVRPARNRLPWWELFVAAVIGFAVNLITGKQGWPGALTFVRDYPVVWLPAFLLFVVAAEVGNRALSSPRRRWSGKGNPYPGLTPFTAEFAPVFHGRELEVRNVVDRIRTARRPAERFISVVGPSGSGKSSMLAAGVIPELTRRRRAVSVWVTLGIEPVRSLAGALVRDPTAGDAHQNLIQELHAEARQIVAAAERDARLDRPTVLLDQVARLRRRRIPFRSRLVVLFIDQLERAIPSSSPPGQDRLLALLAAAVANDNQLRVVATIRSEFLGQIQSWPDADLTQDPVSIGVLPPDRLRQAITAPAQAAGGSVPDEVVDRMIVDSRGGDGLPQLSYLLHELWERRNEAGEITMLEYERANGVEGALRRHADRVLAGAERQHDRASVLRTLLQFVSWDGPAPTGRDVPASDISAPQQLSVVQAFVSALLIAPTTDQPGFRLAHEVLLRRWDPLRDEIGRLETELKARTQVERLAAEWQASKHERDRLISGMRLRRQREAIAAAAQSLTIPALVHEYLDACVTADWEETVRLADNLSRKAIESAAHDPELAKALAMTAVQSLVELIDAGGGPEPARGTATWLPRFALRSVLDAPLRHVLRLPGTQVMAVAWSTGGELAIGGYDGVVLRWRPAEAEPRTVGRHSAAVRAVVWAPDGRLATGGDDGVQVWPTDERPPTTLPPEQSWALGLAWSQDGLLAVGRSDGTVWTWRPGHGDPIKRGSHGSWVGAVAWAPDGRLATAGATRHAGSVQVWPPSGDPPEVVDTQEAQALTVAWAMDGRLAFGGFDRKVRVWQAGRSASVIGCHEFGVRSVAWAPDGRLASGASDGSLRIWPDGDGTFRALGGHESGLRAVAWSADGRLASGGEDATVRIWQFAAGPSRTIDRRDEPVYAAVWLPDGRLVYGGSDGALMTWRAGAPTAELDRYDTQIWSIAAARDGRLAVGTEDGAIRIIGAGGPVQGGTHSEGVSSLAWAGDGRLASGGPDGHVRIWSTAGLLAEMGEAGERVRSLSWTPDGGLATADTAGKVRLWQAGLEDVTVLANHDFWASVACSDQGDIASSGADGSILRWVGGRGQPTEIGRHDTQDCVLSWSREGLLAAGTGDGSLLVWPRTGNPVEIGRHDGGMTSLAWSATGDLVAADERGAVRVWHLEYDARQLLDEAHDQSGRMLTEAERLRYGVA